MNNILIIDDDEAICAILKDVLAIEGYEVSYALTGEDGIRMYREVLPAVLLLDLRLPGMDGLAVLKDVMAFDPDAIVIMITGYGSVDSAVGAIRLGAFDYLQKPLSNDEILLKIGNALRNKMVMKELYYLKEYINKRFSMENIIRESEVMAAVVQKLEKTATYDKPILIRGEPGTGKDLAAWAVHHSGRRREKPMIIFDCSAYPPSMIETELFGGQFNGVHRRGKIEDAELGTLYLDRMERLPLQAQEILLGIAQHKSLARHAGREQVVLDVHLIASTTSDLKGMTDAGRFNSRLFDLLQQYEVVLPPLRERETDIPLIASYFLQQSNKEFGLDITGIEPTALRKLLNHTWPGNVRELRNVIRTAVHSAHGTIKEKDIILQGRS
jgi:DNA-binding NtrC family response regulator